MQLQADSRGDMSELFGPSMRPCAIREGPTRLSPAAVEAACAARALGFPVMKDSSISPRASCCTPFAAKTCSNALRAVSQKVFQMPPLEATTRGSC